MLSDYQLTNFKPSLANQSSINKLASLSNKIFEDLIRGKNNSLGGIIQTKYNFKVVPSPTFPSPNKGNYYKGGFITQIYSSAQMSQYRLNAIQIELPSDLRHGSISQIIEDSKKLADCIFDFYFINSFDFKNCPILID